MSGTGHLRLPHDGPVMSRKRAVTRDQVRDIYDRYAGIYDVALWFYYLAGMRINHWRRLAVAELSLVPGDTVVEIGCGTGLNFALLERAVGRNGKIIGVDISAGMLKKARKRVAAAGWHNVELVCAPGANYRFPKGIGGVLATGVLTYDPDFDTVIAHGAAALAPGRRWVVLDYKKPDNWRRHLIPLFVALEAAFGVSRALMERHIWESVQRRLKHTRMREFYGGFVYIVSGEAS